jgi:sugar-specific transcriptional regulator TrmB
LTLDKDINSKLSLLGLSDTEAKLYQAGLSIGKSIGVIQLQKLVSLKRPTIYHALDTLAAKGLVAKVASANRQLYSFTPPSQLERLMEAGIVQAQRKLRLAVQLTPILENLQLQAGSTIVSHYEGVEGVKAVIDMALFCKVPKWDILAPRKNFFSEFDERYSRYYLTTRKRHDIVSRSLWERTPDGKFLTPGGKPLDKDDLAERQPRYLPQLMQGKFKSTMILFDDKVALISSLSGLSAILITSEEIHDFFEAMFEGLWSVSTPYRPQS